MPFLKRLKYEFTSITIEPFILFFILARMIDQGAQVTTNLMIWKICELELNETSEVCSNLTLAENEEVNHEVQRQVATIQAGGLYIGAVPALFYSLFVGALSDDFGRKPLVKLAINILLL